MTGYYSLTGICHGRFQKLFDSLQTAMSSHYMAYLSVLVFIIQIRVIDRYEEVVNVEPRQVVWAKHKVGHVKKFFSIHTPCMDIQCHHCLYAVQETP